jgi:hypothetical protein
MVEILDSMVLILHKDMILLILLIIEVESTHLMNFKGLINLEILLINLGYLKVLLGQDKILLIIDSHPDLVEDLVGLGEVLEEDLDQIISIEKR